MRPCACGVRPSIFIEAPVPLDVVGESAEMTASCTCDGPLNTTVWGGPPTNRLALRRPACADTVAANVTADVLVVLRCAGDVSVTPGRGGLVSVARSSRSKLTSELVPDCW